MPVTQARMQLFPIIDLFDKIGNAFLHIGQGFIFPEINLFGLYGLQEALGHCIVIRIPSTGHTDPKAMEVQSVHIIVSRILNSLVRMMDDSRCRDPDLKGHMKRPEA